MTLPSTAVARASSALLQVLSVAASISASLHSSKAEEVLHLRRRCCCQQQHLGWWQRSCPGDGKKVDGRQHSFARQRYFASYHGQNGGSRMHHSQSQSASVPQRPCERRQSSEISNRRFQQPRLKSLTVSLSTPMRCHLQFTLATFPSFLPKGRHLRSSSVAARRVMTFRHPLKQSEPQC